MISAASSPMGNNIPKNHHFVPQLLLKGFTDDAGKLWVYDTELQRKWVVADTKSAGAENDFHTVSLKEGVKDRSSIENWVTKYIDTPGYAAIQALFKREFLTDASELDFMRLVAAQFHRTPSSLRKIKELMTPVLQESVERMAKFDHTLRDNILARFTAEGIATDQLDQMLSSIGKGEAEINLNRDFVLISALDQIEPTAAVLCQMSWQFLTTAESDPDLIISDHPVALTDCGDANPQQFIGIQNPNIEITMPLSKRMVAIARWSEEPVSYGTLVKGRAEVINERTMRYAERFIYASRDSDDLLKSAVNLRGTGPKVHVERADIDGKSGLIQSFY